MRGGQDTERGVSTSRANLRFARGRVDVTVTLGPFPGAAPRAAGRRGPPGPRRPGRRPGPRRAGAGSASVHDQHGRAGDVATGERTEGRRAIRERDKSTSVAIGIRAARSRNSRASARV